MSSRKDYVTLHGSERVALPGARAMGAANPDERIEVTVRLRSRSPEKMTGKNIMSPEKLGAQPINERQYISRDEFRQNFGADPADVTKLEEFAHEHGLAISKVDLAQRTVIMTGAVARFSDAFDVELVRFQHADGEYRGRAGSISIPPELEGIIVGVHGLDNRPQARPHFRLRRAGAMAAGAQSFFPPDVAKLYDFPTDTDGSGQCIALIELGGGYRVRDLKAYCKSLNLAPPKVKAVSVDGGHNHPTHDPNSADGEVMLDIEVAATIAPGAEIVVYFAPNTDNGFLDAITTAIFDNVHKPSIVSISWGGPESSWTQQSLHAFDQAFQDAAQVGVSICCASGDAGSDDGVGDGLQHVDFPASSPYALACGGTFIKTAQTPPVEQVWNDGPGSATGGGVSDAFPLPIWQQGVGVPPSSNPNHNVGRGVPDVAGDADPNSGYIIRVDGTQGVIGGTSAVAPLWAALIALINASTGKPLGYFNPLLYAQLSMMGALQDITTGNNGSYNAATGWDPCTGWGTPDGMALLGAIAGKTAKVAMASRVA
jgi:kumamolisin